MKYTSDELVQMFLDRTGIGGDASGSGAVEGSRPLDVLSLLNEACQSIYGEILKTNEEFFVVTQRFEIQALAKRVRIPARALYGKIRCVMGIGKDLEPYEILPILRENMPRYSLRLVDKPRGWYIEGNYLVLYPVVQEDCTIDLSYYFRPSALVPTAECRRVTGVNLGNGIVSLESAAPTSWTPALSFDFHSSLSGSESKVWGIHPTLVNETEITFNPQEINGSVLARFPVEVGDWLCLEETAALPGMPQELHPLVVQRATATYQRLRDPEAYQLTIAEYMSALNRAKAILAMRVESPGETIPPTGFFIY